MKILLAEDDADLGNVLSQFLQMRGFEVTLATDGNQALEKFGREKFDICVLDVKMPGPDGFLVAEQIRKSGREVPFIFLTARNQKADIITGLKIGADDYITKPFEVEELILRINIVLKRSLKTEAEKIEIKGLVLTMSDLRLKTPLQKHQLTQKEAELLMYLMKNKNEVVPREVILTKFWGENDYFMGRSLDVFISRLRKFLSDEPDVQLNTLRGVGYIFEIIG